jgi:hypothetical protein
VRRLHAAALIVLMALGSVAIWIGLPLAWLWIGSQAQGSSSSPSFGAYALVGFGLLLSVVVVVKGLASLDRTYARVTGAAPEEHQQRPWLRSMRGERVAQRRYTVLDRVMLVSVSVALAALAFWFFFLAGSSLPGS